MSLFEALFNDSSPKSGTHALEKCYEKSHRAARSAFQNLRLGSIKLKISRRCVCRNSQDEDIMTMCLSKSQDGELMMMCQSKDAFV